MNASLFEPDRPPRAAAGLKLVRVAVERGIERAGDLRCWDALTYLGHEEAGEEAPSLGELVTVPLGRGDTPTRGVVVDVGGAELAEGLDLDRLKPVLSRTGAALPQKLVELGRWLSEYYVCPLGMALATMVPASVKAGTGARRVTLLERAAPAPEGLTPAVRRAWERIAALGAERFPLAPRELADEAGTKTLREINRLVELGALVRVEREVVSARAHTLPLAGEGRSGSALALNDEQSAAVEGVASTLGGFAAHLLFGVTGSGKTEVYIRLIERALAGGGTAVVLVPEISLTPQATARFVERFSREGVAVLHSGLTRAERHREWKRAASGGARVVVGARSAVFAPVRRLSLIVIDEEHDGSYKQDQLPRYHARDVAVMRARLEGCPAVLGSATPSMESWLNATAPRAHWRLWRLASRATGGPMPRVEIVDMASALRPPPGKKPPPPDRQAQLSPRLRAALRETLERGEQAIVLLNRRGYSHFLCCQNRACGWFLGCRHCDVRLVVHTGRDLPRGALVRCHHCLAESVVPASCPECGGRLLRLGAGTQRVEEELMRVFSAEHVGPACALAEGEGLARVDSDTMRTGRDFFRTLSDFASGRHRVLLGTQMLAKGHDFPNVSLVGILCADGALAMPDFRAGERTFQLVSQVAGRAGRGGRQGLVIVQAFEPDARPIVLAAGHQYERFAAEELEARRRNNLPPTRRMARIVCRARETDRAREAASAIAEALRACPDEGRREVIGPGPCAVGRIAGYFRHEVLLLAAGASAVQSALQEVRRRGLLRSDARTAVDVDPVALF